MRRRNTIPVLVLALVCVGLWLMPAARTVAVEQGAPACARVTAVDDSDVQKLGVLDYGSQHLEVEVLDGAEKGKTFRANNEIRAQLDVDKQFRVGDVAVVVIPPNGAKPGETLVARDHWRLGWMGVMFGAFCLLLCVFGGWTGAKALFSFLFSCLVVWKLVVPLSLAGWSASWISFAAVCVLTAVIMYLVAGPTRKGVAATLGALLGVFFGLVLAHLFSWLMNINGATMPFVQALLNSGYESMDLADVFVGAMVLASSGAVMDLAMDIAAGIEEVARHNPGLPRRELFLSGLRIGRSVVGTMTTTLLLAYSGGYITLLMVFAAQGTPPLEFLNSTLVSAEVVKTLVGSFALVLVAPFTAFVGAAVLAPRSVREANVV
ncbi:MAG: YibE/F family protein [bacterium]|nr:YibE/F family protein [bacterium]